MSESNNIFYTPIAILVPAPKIAHGATFCKCLYPICLYHEIRTKKHIYVMRGLSMEGPPKVDKITHMLCSLQYRCSLNTSSEHLNVFAFTNGLTLVVATAGALHSCSASIKVDGFAVRESPYWSD